MLIFFTIFLWIIHFKYVTYIRENVCDIFEMNYSQENGEKYKHIIENVKKYVEKMLED